LLLSFLLPLNHNNWEKYLNSSEDKNPLLDSYALTIYSHLLLWLIILIIRHYLRNIYYKRLRVLGYYKHHDLVKCLSLIPAIVLHKSNALLLLLTTILCKYNDKVVNISNGIQLKPINFVQIIITTAVTIIIPFLIKLFYHELKFRSERNPPDIFCVDDPQHLITSAGLNEIGVRYSNILSIIAIKLLIYYLILKVVIIFGRLTRKTGGFDI
jgi:hypothetical protein